ncbi:hypothetical protein WMF37_49715 [Sorangium sp. So ce291]
MHPDLEIRVPIRDPKNLGYHFGTVETDGPELVAWVEERLVLER